MNLHLPEEDLRPLIEATVRQVMAQVAEERGRTAGRLGYTEAEAAELLGLKTHQLRDARRRGEIHARLVGEQPFAIRAALDPETRRLVPDPHVAVGVFDRQSHGLAGLGGRESVLVPVLP